MSVALLPRAKHRSASELEAEVAALRKENDDLRTQVAGLRAQLAERDGKVQELEAQCKALAGKVGEQAQMLFGRKSESREDQGAGGQQCKEPRNAGSGRRPRGQQQGSTGHGRRRHEELPEETVVHELSEADRFCKTCGAPYVLFPGEETSEEIDWEVRVVRRVHRRLQYRRACNCSGTPMFRTAPGPEKLVPKGLFSTGFITRVIVEKYRWARPLHKIISALRLEGADLADGTLVGVLRQVSGLLVPLYEAIVACNRQASALHADETRWRLFLGTGTANGYLWVFGGTDSIVFRYRSGRGAWVLREYLGLGEADAIDRTELLTVICDFYAAYDAVRGDHVVLARCWAHLRRLFLRAPYKDPKDPQLRAWAEQWVERIDRLFRLRAERAAAESHGDFERADGKLRSAIEEFEAAAGGQMQQRRLPAESRRMLEFCAAHWDELTRFVQDKDLPMDNNAAERSLRTPVLCRKNFYGSGAEWSAEATTMFWTILFTAELNGLNPLTFLYAYLRACAQAGGKVPRSEELPRFYPWAVSPADRDRWSRPPKESPG